MKFGALFTNRRLQVTLFQGFASGLPIALTTATLQAWFAVSGVDVVAVGALSLVGQPYVYKFLWAPLLDRYIPPILGKRRGWIFLMQLGLMIGIACMAFLNPKVAPWPLALLALGVAFLSASQDIAIDAYRTELLSAEERGLGAALVTAGYRIAMLISGGLALIVADQLGWRITYLMMAGLMGLQMFITLWSPRQQEVSGPPSLIQALVEPLKEFLSRKSAITILLFIILYKMGDAFVFSLSTKFLLDLHFSLTEIGVIYKTMTLAGILLGVFMGGLIMVRLTLYRSLFYFGILQAVSNFMFVWLALAGNSLSIMGATVFIENFCSGLGTTALVAFLMSVCNRHYTATQFALLSAFSAIARVFIGPLTGLLAEHLGVEVHTTAWATFYVDSFFAAIPGLVVLRYLRDRIEFNVIDQFIH